MKKGPSLFFTIMSFFTAAQAQNTMVAAPPLEIGIDRSLLSSQGEAIQEKTLEDIHALGAVWFRDGPSSGSPRGVANFVDEVRRARQHNLKFLMIVSMMDEDYDDPNALPLNGYGWKEKKLSQINPDKYARRLRTLFNALKTAGLTIDAAEFGSEYDTYAYDADVPNGHAASPEELKTWLRAYGKFLKTGAEVLHDPHYFPHAKIITFGIAHGWTPPHKPQQHFDIPAGVVAMLRDVDGFNYLDNSSYHVDGYGTHLYPSPNNIDGGLTATLREDAAALGPDKPIWITEWGFLDFQAFPNKKGQTLSQGMEKFLSVLDGLHLKIPMGPAMFYRYDVWLTDPAGKLLPSASALSAYTSSGQYADRLADHGNDIVWQLNLKKAPSTDYQLFFTRVATDDKGQAVLEADSRSDKSDWHSFITLPKGLLKAGEDYFITLDYEVIDCSSQGSYFYLFARSGSLGYGADKWLKWSGESGARGTAKLRISPSAGDFQITAGICKQGAIRIRNLQLFHGNGWSTLPLEGTAGKAQALPPSAAQPPPFPTGAQPFTVDAPSNVKGPVLNLADFGADADGDAPPSPGPDRNGAALKAAIAKCRETGASKLIVPKGVYRITSGETIVFDSLDDFIFDGGGSTFLFHQIKGGAGMSIKNCNRTVFRNFNMDWDWTIDPLASVGRVLKVGPNSSFFEMRFETKASLDPKRWVTMNPLDEKLHAPGTGQEFSGFNPKKIDSIDSQTVRVWPSFAIAPIVGRLYLLRHYVDPKHCILLTSNTHLSLQYVTVFSFPGIAFLVGGDQHHFELLHCRITYPENQPRPITTTSDGFHIGQSQGFMRLEDCDFGYMGDDCINIHDDIHSGVQLVDAHTLLVKKIVPWYCPYAAGDLVEIRNGDYSPTGFSGKLKESKVDYKKNEVTLVFEQELPGRIVSDAILFNHRYDSHNCIIRNCYFHENRARGILCNTADWLIEGNHFFHNQFSAMLLLADVGPSWSEGFGAQNVVIRNNRVESSNCIGAWDGAAVGIRATSNGIITHYPLLRNILFENNIFQEMTGPAIEAASFNNLVIRNNKFSNNEKAPIMLKMRGSIQAGFGSGLWVEGNDWTTQNGIESPSLLYDAETTKKIVCQGNHLQN
jgi:Right handed beta helix region